MPYYYTDNLDVYVFTLFTERYESLKDEDNAEEKKEMRDAITGIPIGPLKEWVANWMLEIELIYDNCLFKALLNTIDWDDLRLKLKEWLKDLDDE